MANPIGEFLATLVKTVIAGLAGRQRRRRSEPAARTKQQPRAKKPSRGAAKSARAARRTARRNG